MYSNSYQHIYGSTSISNNSNNTIKDNNNNNVNYNINNDNNNRIKIDNHINPCNKLKTPLLRPHSDKKYTYY